jgi:hypothetical protein
MSLETLTAIAIGMLIGFSLGWVTSWRLARKLEHFGVRLSQWDKPFDSQAPEPGRIIRSEFGG